MNRDYGCPVLNRVWNCALISGFFSWTNLLKKKSRLDIALTIPVVIQGFNCVLRCLLVSRTVGKCQSTIRFYFQIKSIKTKIWVMITILKLRIPINGWEISSKSSLIKMWPVLFIETSPLLFICESA